MYFSYYAKLGNAQSVFIIYDSKRLTKTPITLCSLLMKFFFLVKTMKNMFFSIKFTTHAILACPSEDKLQKIWKIDEKYEIFGSLLFVGK